MGRAGLALLLLLVLGIAACVGQSSQPPAPTDETPAAPAQVDISTDQPPAASSEPRAPVPAVDLSIADVPLDEVVFDTFDGGFVALSAADPALIDDLRDAIEPIYAPAYGRSEELPWLEDDDLVLGYEASGIAYAYPLKILNFRELVNDTIDGVPVLISYCPLCASGVVYERRLDGRTLLFGNTSALFESDLVMFDHETGSYWFQVAGRAIVGELTGRTLPVLPSTVATWGEWQSLHPDTAVLVGDGDESLGGERYARDPFEGYERVVDEGRFAFPVSDASQDTRLRAAEVVLVVEIDGARKAFPGAALDTAVNDQVGAVPVLVVPAPDGQPTAALDRRVGNQVLNFDARGSELVDRETLTTWDRAGRAVDGPLLGERLRLLPIRRAFWFSVATAAPGIEIYGLDG